MITNVLPPFYGSQCSVSGKKTNMFLSVVRERNSRIYSKIYATLTLIVIAKFTRIESI